VWNKTKLKVMEKQKIYVVYYSKGSYEDYEKIIIFATNNEDKAIRYACRYMEILNKLRKHYMQFAKNKEYRLETIEKKYENTPIFKRFYSVMNLGHCFYREVELR
jgi:hypothetical protein